MGKSPETYCKGCWLYDDKGLIAERISDLLAEIHEELHESKWDFEVCSQGCWKKLRERTNYDKNKAHEYYHQKHPQAVYR